MNRSYSQNNTDRKILKLLKPSPSFLKPKLAKPKLFQAQAFQAQAFSSSSLSSPSFFKPKLLKPKLLSSPSLKLGIGLEKLGLGASLPLNL